MAELITNWTESYYYHVHPTMTAALAPTQLINACNTSTGHLMGLKINHNQTKRDPANEFAMASILQNPEKRGEV